MRSPTTPRRPATGPRRVPRSAGRRLGDLLLVVAVLLLLPAGVAALRGAAPVWTLVLALAGQAVLYTAQQLLLRARLRKALPSTWVAGVASALALSALLMAWFGDPLAGAAGIGAPQSLLALALVSSAALVAGSALATARLCGVRGDPRLAWTAAGTTTLVAAQVLVVLLAAGVVDLPRGLVVALVAASLACAAGVLAARPHGVPAQRRPAVGYDATGAVFALTAAVSALVVGDLRQVPLTAVVVALLALVALASSVSLLAREVLALQGARHDARTDELTGAVNRRGFRSALLAALGGADQRGTALVLVDLDGFKGVNDTHGHLAGDDLLRAVSGRLRAAVRPGDLVARIGGDEFAVLLRGADAADAARAVERVQACFTEPVQVRGTALRVGASAGTALARPGPAADAEARAEDLLHRADAAMYAAKATGTGTGDGPSADGAAPVAVG